MTAALFLVLLLATAAGVWLATRRYLSARAARLVQIGLPLWLLYVGVVSASGVLRDATLRPPAALLLFVPVLLFMALFAVRSRAGARVALALPLTLLTGAQVFRVGVEIGLHRLGGEGLVPRLMTIEGGNVDILIGLSAPLMAWLCGRGAAGRRLVAGWNVLGLLALANIIVRSVLTAPGPLHLLQTDVPNLAIGLFPYSYLAGFFAPLGVLLHVLSLRAWRAATHPESGAAAVAAG